jgi:hypothetical protein
VWKHGELPEYIDVHPSADRLGLVGFCCTTLGGVFTPSPAI